MQIVILLVAHHDQMFAWSLKKSFPNGRATGISLAGPFQLVADVAGDRETNIGCEKVKDGPGKREAEWASTETNRAQVAHRLDRKSTRLNSSHRCISYAVFCLKKKNTTK